MYTSVEQFLQQQYWAICDIMSRAADQAGGHYAAMTPAVRRQNAEHDTLEFVQAVSEGRMDRRGVQATGARPTDTGLVADDLLRLTYVFEPAFVALVERELAANPELRVIVLRRTRNLNAMFRASLTSAQIDRVLQQFQPPPSQAPNDHPH